MMATRKVLAPLGVLLVTWCTLVTSREGIPPQLCPNCYKNLCKAPNQTSPQQTTYLLNTLYPGLFRNISTIRKQYNVPQECGPVCTANRKCSWRCNSASAWRRFNCMKADGGSCCETCFSMTNDWYMVDVLHYGMKYVVHLPYQFQTWDEAKDCIPKNCDGVCKKFYGTRQVLVSDEPPPHYDIDTFYWGTIEYPSHCICTNNREGCKSRACTSAGSPQTSTFPLFLVGLLCLHIFG